jgi:hypothetical protein
MNKKRITRKSKKKIKSNNSSNRRRGSRSSKKRRNNKSKNKRMKNKMSRIKKMMIREYKSPLFKLMRQCRSRRIKSVRLVLIQCCSNHKWLRPKKWKVNQ